MPSTERPTETELTPVDEAFSYLRDRRDSVTNLLQVQRERLIIKSHPGNKKGFLSKVARRFFSSADDSEKNVRLLGTHLGEIDEAIADLARGMSTKALGIIEVEATRLQEKSAALPPTASVPGTNWSMIYPRSSSYNPDADEVEKLSALAQRVKTHFREEEAYRQAYKKFD
jgi:hypothetical protein